MNQEEEIAGRFFEWDEEKNKINMQKHHISFRAASYVFIDENRLEIFDEKHSDFEDRFKVIDMVSHVLCVVCTERGLSTIIISARYADARERRLYYGNSEEIY